MKSKDEKKYNRIKQSAIDLIVSDGIAGASMSKIAKKANISASTIYVYFENREKMINDIYISSKIELSNFLLKEIDFEQDIKTVFKSLWRGLHKFILENQNIFYFLEQFENSPYVDKLEDKKTMEIYFSSFFNFSKKAKSLNVVKNLPDEVLKAFAMPTISYLTKLHLKGVINLTDELLDDSLEMCWSAIQK
jgi:AcrR family transcriptional regulator